MIRLIFSLMIFSFTTVSWADRFSGLQDGSSVVIKLGDFSNKSASTKTIFAPSFKLEILAANNSGGSLLFTHNEELLRTVQIDNVAVGETRGLNTTLRYSKEELEVIFGEMDGSYVHEQTAIVFRIRQIGMISGNYLEKKAVWLPNQMNMLLANSNIEAYASRVFNLLTDAQPTNLKLKGSWLSDIPDSIELNIAVSIE